MAVVVTMIGFGKFLVPCHLAAQDAACERQPDDDADIISFGQRKQRLDRVLAENIEDDLQRHHARALCRHDRFLDGFHAGAERPDQPLVLEILHPCNDVTRLEDLRRHAMQLHQVEGIHAQAPCRAFDVRPHVFLRIPLRVKPRMASDFGRDDRPAFACLDVPGDSQLAQAVAVDVGGVPEADAVFVRLTKYRLCAILTDRPEVAAELPATEPDLGYANAALSKKPCFQRPLSPISAGSVAAPAPVSSSCTALARNR
jgi:hypothetical protein